MLQFQARAHRPHPAVDRAQPPAIGYLHSVIEGDVGALVLKSMDRLDRHAFGLQRHDEHGQPLMLGHVRVGPAQHQHIGRQVRPAGEHLGPIDPPATIGFLRRAALRGEHVGPCAWLGIAQRADDFAAHDFGQDRRLQFLAAKAMDDQRDHLRNIRSRIIITLRLERIHRGGLFIGGKPAPADILRQADIEQILRRQFAVEVRVIALPAIMKRLAHFRRHMRGEEILYLLGDGARVVAQIEIDRHVARIRQGRLLARIESSPGLADQPLRIAQQQRPGLGAQVEQENIIFGGQAITAKCVQRLCHRPARRIAVPPGGNADRRSRLRRAIGNVADRLPHQELAAVDIAQQIGEGVGNPLKLADILIELLALARIGRRQLQRLAPDPG